tara:strand:+ start:2772 stop:4739 length:1968 start_codon:yes stop_codon:yes gene_type:complete
MLIELHYSEPTSEKIIKSLGNAGKITADLAEPNTDMGFSWRAMLNDLIDQGQIAEDWLVEMLSKNTAIMRSFPTEDGVDTKALNVLPFHLLKQFSALPYAFEEKQIKVLILDPFTRNELNKKIREETNYNPFFELTSLSHMRSMLSLAEVNQALASLKSSSSSQAGEIKSQQNIRFSGLQADSASQKHAPLISPNRASPAAENKVVADDGESQPQEEKTEKAESEKKENQTDKKSQPQEVKKKDRPETPAREFKYRDKWQASDPDLVVRFCDQILHEAVKNKVSDIHIECFRDSAKIRMRLDGTMIVKPLYSEYLFKNYSAIITRFKIMAECDISERRLPQDGAITIRGPGNQDIDFRFNVLPTKNGERIVMRILAGDPALSLDKLGFDKDDYNKIIDAISAPQGMVLVTGPTGSGKTTTLYGALQYINKPDINILTAEDPVEYYLEGAGQVQANEKIGLTFSEILRSFLRQDPEVILVGEIRDQETIDIAIKAALTGHLLLSTLHTNDSISTITRLQNMGVPNFMISSALSVIIAQRLARTNCANCLEDDPRATIGNLLKIGFSEDRAKEVKAKRGKGCATCNGTGLKGRKGIYEVLRMTKKIEQAIINNATAPDILKAAKEDGFKTMQEIARGFVAEGLISIEEFQSTLNLES